MILMFLMEQCYLHLWWYLFDLSPLCIFKCVLKSPAWTDAKSHRLHLFDFFSTVHLQMCPQTVCPRGRIITLVAFVGLFSTVPFQLCIQIACSNGCKVTLVAIVWLFSTVHFQMSPKITCLNEFKLVGHLKMRVSYKIIKSSVLDPFHWRSLVLPPLKMSHITMNTKTSFHVYA